MTGRRKKPQALGDALKQFLDQAGLTDRVAQAEVIPEWPSLVGEQIARVTVPLSVTADGTLFVAVTTHAWMTELSLMEPELLTALNACEGRPAVGRIRWLLKRE